MKASKFDISLIQCYKCGGYFNEDRIDAHAKICIGLPDEKPTAKKPLLPSYTFDSEDIHVDYPQLSTNLLSNLSSNASYNELFVKKPEKETKVEPKLNSSASSNQFTRPNSLVCYLCGKEFGTNSLEIHLKSCRKNFQASNKGKDPDSLKPDILDEVLEMIASKKAIDNNLIIAYNQEAEKNYKDINYFPCQTCGRKFPEDRLEIHLRGCKPKSGWQNVLSTKTTGNKLNKSTELTSSNTAPKTPKKISNETKIPKIIKQQNTESNNNNTGLMGFGQKPNFLICFLCGREFGKYSIEIHIKACIEKQSDGDPKSFEKSTKSKKKDNLDIKYPEELEQIFAKLDMNEEVTVNEILNYNQVANQLFRDNTMKPCPMCNRKFLPDRLEVHLRSCKPKVQSSSTSDSAAFYKRAVSPNIVSRPKMLVCPLCGREFGTLSLPIHMKTCKEKFELEQQRLPKNQRRSAEAIIEKYNQMGSEMKNEGRYSVLNLNNDAYKMWNDEVLVPCENCGRTFLPDRLTVHLRSCKKK